MFLICVSISIKIDQNKRTDCIEANIFELIEESEL